MHIIFYLAIALIFTINAIEFYYFDNNIITFIIIFALTVFMWIYKWMDSTLVCIFFIILVVLTGILQIDEALSGLGEPIIWMIISFLIISNALKETELEEIFDYLLTNFSKSKVSRIFFILAAMNLILAILIPNAVIRLNIMQDITKKYREKQNSFSAALTLFITFAPYLTTTLTITASTGTLLAVTLYKEIYDFSWDYLTWFILVLPVYLSAITLTTLIILSYYKISSRDVVDKDIKLLEKISLEKQQIKLFIIYFFTILGFFTVGYHGISIYLIALVAMFMIHIPPFKVVEWKSSIKSVNWNIPIMFATSFTIAKSFEASGLLDFVTRIYNQYGDIFNTYTLVIFLTLLIIIVRLFFTNFNSFIAAFFPLILSLSNQMDLNAIWISFFLLNIMSIGYILPSQSIGSMITIQENKYSYKDFVWVGVRVTLLVVILYLFFGILYWPLII